jgi:hypothetical protein
LIEIGFFCGFKEKLAIGFELGFFAKQKKVGHGFVQMIGMAD